MSAEIVFIVLGLAVPIVAGIIGIRHDRRLGIRYDAQRGRWVER